MHVLYWSHPTQWPDDTLLPRLYSEGHTQQQAVCRSERKTTLMLERQVEHSLLRYTEDYYDGDARI